MENEIWKPIEGFDGCYEVSNLGRVKSIDRIIKINTVFTVRKGRMLKLVTSKIGYVYCTLVYKGKVNTYLVHRLVAQAFISNPDNLREVNHKDEDKTNNRVDNLEWCDHIYNANYGTAIERRLNSLVDKGIADPNNIGGKTLNKYERELYRERYGGRMKYYNQRRYLKNKRKKTLPPEPGLW